MNFLKKNKEKIIALTVLLLLLLFSYNWGGILQQEKTGGIGESDKSVQKEIGIKISDEESEKPVKEEPQPYSVLREDKENAEGENKVTTLTDDIPAPTEPQSVTITDKACTCTISVLCDTALANINLIDEEKILLLPEDGVILPPTEVVFYEGESVFNILLREMKKNKIHMEYVSIPIYNSAYIEGINNLYEFDCGELSGWMYRVNGEFPSYGCSQYQLQPGDRVEWVYTCDLGRDVGKIIN